MTIERVKCAECDNMILPQTAADNAGLCAPCAKTPESLRSARRGHESELSSGRWFIPSSAERGTASRPVEFGDPVATWNPEPEYYEGQAIRSAREAIDAAKNQLQGHAFLVSDRGGRLSLAFNATFGVCEYLNEATGENRYAYTPQNLAKQVSGDLHLLQACPSDGVGLFWYPSRFHMPRATAFAIFSAVALGTGEIGETSVQWLDCGDISYTARGRG